MHRNISAKILGHACHNKTLIIVLLGRRIVEAESEFAKLDLAEDDVIKSVYEGSKSNKYIENKSIIRSDGGNIQDDSVANPNLNIPRPQVNI